MRLNKTGIDLIKQYEGLRLDAYICPAGKPTIGYGATGPDIKLGLHWTLLQAEKDLMARLETLEKRVLEAVKTPLNDNQLSAIISLVYNIGIGAFKSSTLLKLLNKKEYESAALEFPKWNKANGKVLSGLVRRREAEKVLFNTK